MTVESNSPENGQESSGIDWRGTPCENGSNEEIAMLLEEEKQAVRVACDDVARALLNEDVPLTDEKVAEMDTHASRLKALVRTLTPRVPREYRVEVEAREPDK